VSWSGAGPTNASGPGGVRGLTRSRVSDLATNSSGRPAVESLGTSTTSTLARAATIAGASSPTPRMPASTFTDGLDPARTAVVGYEPPRQEHTAQPHEGDEGRTGRTKRRRRAVLPTGFARSARPLTVAEQVWCRADPDHGDTLLDTFIGEEPVSQARHATAFTSSGVTNVLVDNTRAPGRRG